MKSAKAIFNNVCRRIVFRSDGSLTWFGWLCLLGAGILAAAVLSMFQGCVNFYTRLPITDSRIESCYQSSRSAACLSIIVAFPQMMSDNPGTPKYMIENIFTVPLGCVVLCDAACEAVIDTAMLPIDWPLSEYRNGKSESESQNTWYEEDCEKDFEVIEEENEKCKQADQE